MSEIDFEITTQLIFSEKMEWYDTIMYLKARTYDSHHPPVKRGCKICLGIATTEEDIKQAKEKILLLANSKKGLPYVVEGHEYPLLEL